MKLTDELIANIIQATTKDGKGDTIELIRTVEAEVLRLNGITGDGRGEAAPLESSKEASDAIDKMLAEYNYPSNTKNAARAGWRACRLYSAPPQQQQAAPIPERCQHGVRLENRCPTCDAPRAQETGA